MFLAQNFLRIPNISYVFSYGAWNFEKKQSEKDVIPLRQKEQIFFFAWSIAFVCGNVILIQSKHTLV